MAGNSVIGALRVDLGLNSAQFTAGLKQAESGLAAFGRTAAAGLQIVAVAAIAAGVAMGTAVKHAIDHADALNKSAQKAGVTVEALSRLEYAAKLSDISLDGLTGGLQKLSKSMAEAAGGKGPAAAFQALGVSVKNADGTLRSSVAVFGDVAERFSRMQDGATKTALAIQIFGKSGAELIPLLNSGSQGLADMAAEADHLGITISSSTAASAEKFNDTLTRIGQIMEGVVNKVMEAALPALQNLADLLASPDFSSAAQSLAKNIVTGLDTIIAAVVNTINAVERLKKALDPDTQTIIDRANAERGLGPALHLHPDFLGGGSGLSGTGASGAASLTGTVLGAVVPSTFDFRNLLDPQKGVGGATKALKDWNDEIDGTVKRNQELAASIRDGVTGAVQGFINAIIQGTDPLRAFGDQLLQIGQQMLNGGIQSLISSIFTPNFIGGSLGAPALKLGFQTGIPGFASGTGSAPAGMAWVGESGPELVNFRGGEQVIPNGALGGQSTVRIDLGPGLVGSILEQSKNQSIQIVRSGASSAVAADRRNRVR